MSFNRGAVAVFVAIVAACSIISAQGRSLRLVSPVRPPFTDAPGKPRFALDLVEAALQRINVTATTTLVPANQYATSLMSGPYDGTAVGWRDAAREKALLFSEPYMENRLRLVGKSGADMSAQSLSELKGRTIAVVIGYAYGDETEAAGPTWIRAASEQDCLKMVLDGAVDYMLMDDLVVQYMLDAYPTEARTRLSIGVLPLLRRPVHLTLHKSLPDAAMIIRNFNAQLKRMIVDRTYHQLLHVNWIYTDVDGDGERELIGASDEGGTSPPQRSYSLFAQDQQVAQTQKGQDRYYFGGAVYNGWSSVPDRYKVDHLDRPDHVHPAANVFTMAWK